MKREIIFRGKAIKNTFSINKKEPIVKIGDWIYGDLEIQRATGKHIIHAYHEDGTYKGQYEAAPETVGQYTGLKDKNGKEIYEGDVLKIFYYGKSKVFGVVKYVDCRFYIDDDCDNFRIEPKAPMSEMFEKYEFEVIGNIHDNPELLKGGAK